MEKIYQRNVINTLFFKAINKVLTVIENIKWKARYAALASEFKHLGPRIIFSNGVKIINPSNISIGERAFVGEDTILNAGRGGEITIGPHCGIAAGCRLITWNHDCHNSDLKLHKTPDNVESINLGTGVWLGYNTIILPGVTLGDGVVVGAGSVVTESFDDYDIISGVPARKNGSRVDN